MQIKWIGWMLGAALGLASLTAHAAWTDKHVAGAREHPLLKFYPQAAVAEYDHKEFDSAEVVTAYRKGVDEPAKLEAVEGRVTRYRYEHKPNTSPLEIVRQYESALKGAGFTTIVAGKASTTPGVPEVAGDDAFGAFRLDRAGKPAAFVQVVAIYNGGPDTPESSVVIVEPKVMEQKLEANADAWFAEINKSGRVAVYGVQFDTGKAQIKPQSAAVLGEIKKLLAAHPELALRIEGHTDNVGQSAANKKLSEDRAAAVKTWLVAQGAREANLGTAGWGDSKPIADNGTDEGRAKNRRVELVRR